MNAADGVGAGSMDRDRLRPTRRIDLVYNEAD